MCWDDEDHETIKLVCYSQSFAVDLTLIESSTVRYTNKHTHAASITPFGVGHRSFRFPVQVSSKNAYCLPFYGDFVEKQLIVHCTEAHVQLVSFAVTGKVNGKWKLWVDTREKQ